MILRALVLLALAFVGCATRSPESQSDYARGFRAGYKAGATEAVQLLQ